MKKVLLIRRKKEYFCHGEIGWEYKDFYKENLLGWNFIFKMDYNTFRSKLVKISQSTISNNNFDIIMFYEDREMVESFSSGTLLFPVDDDDWLSSSLLLEIENNFDGSNLYWNIFRSYLNGCKTYKMSKNNTVIPSCSYCVVLPYDFESISCHWKFKNKDAKYINKFLNFKLDTVASIGILKRKPLIFNNVIKNLYQGTLSSNNIPLEFRNCWKRYNEVCKELLDSCKFSYEHIIEEIKKSY